MTDELLQVARDIEGMKRECGMDPESPVAIYNSRLMGIAYRVRVLAETSQPTERMGAAPGEKECRHCGWMCYPKPEAGSQGWYPLEQASRLATPATEPAVPAGEVAGWQPIATAPKGVVVLVYTPPQPGDWPDQLRIDFDCIGPDYEGWTAHSELYDHYMAVGGSDAAGPDMECVGPAQEAPYTHWMPLPPPPAIDQAMKGGEG